MVTKLYPDKDYFILRNVQTKTPMGFKKRGFPENLIYVLPNSSVDRFVEDFQAFKNYEMGIAVEVYDGLTKKVDRFVLLYAFKIGIPEKGSQYKVYNVFEEKLSNLDMLELLDHYKKDPKERKTLYL